MLTESDLSMLENIAFGMSLSNEKKNMETGKKFLALLSEVRINRAFSISVGALLFAFVSSPTRFTHEENNKKICNYCGKEWTTLIAHTKRCPVYLTQMFLDTPEQQTIKFAEKLFELEGAKNE